MHNFLILEFKNICNVLRSVITVAGSSTKLLDTQVEPVEKGRKLRADRNKIRNTILTKHWSRQANCIVPNSKQHGELSLNLCQWQ